MPYFAFSNDLIAQILVDHFGNGIPLGTLARRANVKKSALRHMAHRVAEMLEGGLPALLDKLRSAPVKHADEMRVSRFAARNEPRNRLTHYLMRWPSA